ncbi:DUF5331 domain-containing protein [Cronbergia sp. UHCC 0137]|uniref:DUF5331 domain-containing protein n=1 Tax=Cronbergia sp. UHCC 0137 TaxID=3110239 RepID=UPI002B20E7C9|nr:DUF5331 domain-containing protein [Cronbergia sp. UHCC 0137]MEA5620434.1 DUF5331 domain-containing protein [Cronbergia sp. UHCC 0137]
MAFFTSFTDSLRQKWLQFFQVNRDWITIQMAVESVYTPDGGKRPPSYLILGVVNALEPKLAQLMSPFAKLNPDADTLIEVLDLNFDPDIALGNRLSMTALGEYTSESDVVTDSNPKNQSSTNGFGEQGVTQNDDHINGFGNLDDQADDLNPPDEIAFSDVLSDVWSDETLLLDGQENNDLLSEELSSGVFDESEMARLFPNN